jgi:hypothetical protein
MGGYGSGRSGGRATTEDGLKLTLSKLLRDQSFQPGFASSGSLTWTNTMTGQRVGSIGYEAYLRQESGRVRLKYTTTQRSGERRESDYWIELETTPQPFGGRRWRFVCPRTGRRAAKLYLPNGAFTFAARQVYPLAYQCQREQPHDRALRRAFKLRAQLGGDGGIGDYILKPKWMRWPTFDRAMGRIERAEKEDGARLLRLLNATGRLAHPVRRSRPDAHHRLRGVRAARALQRGAAHCRSARSPPSLRPTPRRQLIDDVRHRLEKRSLSARAGRVLQRRDPAARGGGQNTSE